MALALTLNGSATGSIPGSPSNGDRIAMANGTLRVSFVYGTTHSGTQWALDLIEYSSDGSNWTSLLYAKDSNRMALAGAEHQATNGALSIITNTVSTLTLQLQATFTSGTTYTFTNQYTMTSTQVNVEVAQYLACSAQVALSSNQYLENWGAAWLAAGTGSGLALYNNVGSPFGSTRTLPCLWTGNLAIGRQFSQLANTQRGYGAGMSMLLASGHICSWVTKPSAQQNLYLNILDASNSSNLGSSDWQYAKGYVSFFKGVDTAYTSVLDNNACFVRPGARWGTSGSSTFPQSASNTDATTTLNFVWSLVVESVSTPGVTGLPYARYLLPQRLNYWMDTLYPRPNIGGSGILGGGTSPMWQSLATLESTVLPFLLSTYTTIVDGTYGYQQSSSGGSTIYHNYTNSLALQTALRWLNFGVGNFSDAQTMADKMAVIIANYQVQNGNQAGAIYKVRSGSSFICQENNHSGADQPHVVMYSMAESLYAIIEYYSARGNRTLAATYGNITVAALLDAAMGYLVRVQTTDGAWLVDYNTSNTYTSTGANTGSTMPGSATVDLAASLYSWSLNSPTASASTKATWQAQALRAIRYYIASESVAHGNFEFGEGYVTYSHHGLKQLIRGFGRMYKMTGSAVYQEWMAYYFEQCICLCKRVDEIINNAGGTNSQDVHTGGLVSTLDWNGVVSGEASSGWAYILSDMAALHPGLLAHHYFYMWANLCHITWGYRDSSTYNSSYQSSYAYASPGTTFSGSVNTIDNSRFSYFTPGAALLLMPTRSLVACDNANVLSTCLEANLAATTPAGRTIALYNPQLTSQSINLTVRNMANKQAQRDGSTISTGVSGSDMTIALSLTAGQISKIVVR